MDIQERLLHMCDKYQNLIYWLICFSTQFHGTSWLIDVSMDIQERLLNKCDMYQNLLYRLLFFNTVP